MKKLVPLVLVCLLALLTLSATASASTMTLAKLAKQVAALQKKVKTQATTITSQGATIMALSSDLVSAQSAITALQNSQTAGVSGTDFDALAARVTIDESNTSALQTSVSGLNTQVGNQGNVIIALADLVGQDANSGLRGAVAAHTSVLTSAAPVLAIAPYVSLKTGTLNGVVGPNIVFQGANVHVRSSTSENDSTGTGNLIVGWDDNPSTTPAGYRSGSNNLVCGDKQTFHSYGGFVAGCANGVGDAYATVAGYGNNVSGYCATVSGGSGNTASMAYSAISGGSSNYTAGNGVYAVVSGGGSNGATGRNSVVSAGQGLTATADNSWAHPN
jgi:hypothetical protein